MNTPTPNPGRSSFSFLKNIQPITSKLENKNKVFDSYLFNTDHQVGKAQNEENLQDNESKQPEIHQMLSQSNSPEKKEKKRPPKLDLL